jgi:predicted PurR-regulated permease PerM
MTTREAPIEWSTPARYLAIVLLLITLLVMVIFIKPVFATVGLGFIFALIFHAPIKWLSKFLKGKYNLATLVFCLLVAIVIILLILVALGYLVDNGNSLREQLSAALDSFTLPPTIPESITNAIQQFAGWYRDTLASLIIGIVGFIGLVFVALFFSALLLINLNQARGSLAKVIPDSHQNEIQRILTNLDGVWAGYMTAQIIYATVLAIGSWIEYTLLGVPYPIVLAILTGLLSLIPSIGGWISNILVDIPCLLLGSTRFPEMSNLTFTIIVALINIVITQISYNFIALPVVSKYVRLPVALVFITVLAGVATGNILLAFLIVPILSTITIVGGYLLSKFVKRDIGAGITSADRNKAGFFSQLLSIKEFDSMPAEAPENKSSVPE